MAARRARESAGILAFRRREGGPEVLLVHPGGPFWAKKDLGAWTLPKGEVGPGEEPRAAALREFEEETGHEPSGETLHLEPVRQKGGKLVHAWALETDLDAAAVRSNTFTMEWPMHSGKQQEFPEIDRARWMGVEEARRHLLPALVPLLDQLLAALRERDERGER
jgi:predicted NUDIX family NTP pyrophosphohydrolase